MDQLNWSGVKIHNWVKEQLGTEIGYSTTLRYLNQLGYNLRVPRSWQKDPNIEIWLGDECTVEGDPPPDGVGSNWEAAPQ